MKVIAKPTMRQYEVLLTEADLRSSLGLVVASDTIHVSHVDRAPNADDFLVRICITAVTGE